MRKFSRIVVLAVIFCLLFTTAAFGAYGDDAVSMTNERESVFRCGQLPFAPGHEFQLVTLDDVAWRSGEYSGTPTVEKIPAKFPHYDTPTETPLLVLVLEFNNISYQDDYDWGNTIFQGEYSLAQYYKDMSFNQFSFVPAKETSAYNVGGNHNTKDKANDGIVHITVDQDHGCWDLEDEEEDAKWISCLVEGIKKADEYADFASFDANDDGYIDTDEMALAVVVAGYEAAYDDSFTEGADYYLWSHAWNIYSAWWYYFSDEYPDEDDFMPCPDDVYVDSYIAIPEQLEKDWQEPISVLAHELGHYLGLPDLYTTDYDYSALWGAYDVGYLSVMCSGSWGYNSDIEEYLPVAFDAWSRSVLGWVKPTIVNEGTYDVVSDSGEYNVLLVETGVEGDYYLLENREFTGWDEGLEIYSGTGYWSGYCYADYADNGGLICWHVDDEVYDEYEYWNEVNNTYHRPCLMPLFPEEDEDGNITFIGEIDFDYGTAQPFFTYDIWQDMYASEMDYVDFPVYNGSDDFEDRSFSGVHMEILQPDAAHSVKVRFGNTAAHEHVLTLTEAVDATCTEPGNSEYWTCDICGKYFSDAEGTTEIQKDSWVIEALGHNWDEGMITKEPTCTGPGVKTFTCTRCNETRTESIAALGHDWDKDNVEFTWDTSMGLYGSAYAIFTCKRDPSHTETVQATVTYESGEGIHTYTATAVFEGETYIDQRTETYYVGPPHLRIQGSDRYETALLTADHMKQRMTIDKFDTVIVADGRNFADALSGSYLAAVTGAPILLVHPVFEQKIADYIKANVYEGGRIYILGGPNAVSDNFKSLVPNYDKERLGGADRYETNVLILKAANEWGRSDKSEVLVCSGTNFADALSTSSVGKPILLVGKNITDKQKQYLTDVKADKAWIVGGPVAVSESVENELAAFVDKANTKRLAGDNRYDTSYQVAHEFAEGKVDTAVLVYGQNFPDGLSGGAVASVIGSPVLLAMNRDDMNAFVAKWVTESGAVSSITLGGPTLISDDSIKSIMNQKDAEIKLFK